MHPVLAFKPKANEKASLLRSAATFTAYEIFFGLPGVGLVFSAALAATEGAVRLLVHALHVSAPKAKEIAHRFMRARQVTRLPHLH